MKLKSTYKHFRIDPATGREIYLGEVEYRFSGTGIPSFDELLREKPVPPDSADTGADTVDGDDDDPFTECFMKGFNRR